MITVVDNLLMYIDNDELKNKTINFLNNYNILNIISDLKLDCAYYECPSCNAKCSAYYYLSGSWRWHCKLCFKNSAFLTIQQSIGFSNYSKTKELLINNQPLNIHRIALNLSNDTSGNFQSMYWNAYTKIFEIQYNKSIAQYDINFVNSNDCIFDHDKAKKIINRIMLLK